MAKLRHVAIRCDDLHWGAKFYSECFEMEEVGRVGNLDVAGAVERAEDLLHEPALLLEHRGDGVVVGVGVALGLREVLDLADVAEGEQRVFDGGPVVRHGPYVTRR